MVSVEGTLLKNADGVYCSFGVDVGSVFTYSRWCFFIQCDGVFLTKLVSSSIFHSLASLRSKLLRIIESILLSNVRSLPYRINQSFSCAVMRPSPVTLWNGVVFYSGMNRMKTI